VNTVGRPTLYDPEKLILVEGWARDGLTNEQIAEKLGIAPSTLYEWQGKYSEFAQVLKRGKEIVDREVENALFKRTQGYVVELRKTFKVKVINYDANGRKVREAEELQTGVDEVYVAPDTTAQIFWLKNRKPAEWRDRQAVELTGADGKPLAMGVVILPALEIAKAEEAVRKPE
jgi:transposase-like protein